VSAPATSWPRAVVSRQRDHGLGRPDVPPVPEKRLFVAQRKRPDITKRCFYPGDAINHHSPGDLTRRPLSLSQDQGHPFTLQGDQITGAP
jgi:hypothetical protein